MENQMKEIRDIALAGGPIDSVLDLVEALHECKGCQLVSIINVIHPEPSKRLVFIKPAGPEGFTIDDTVYRVLEDGTFEESIVKKVWLNYLIVGSIATGKEIACHFREVFHDCDSGAARTASTERREVWESNVLRSLAESHSGIHGALNRQAHQVEYKPQQEPEGSFMGDSGF